MEKGFMIGAATAPHQVEGNNRHSDCWAMEHMQYSSYAEPSLDADDHYHLYKEDIGLLANHGLNAYRFGIEWARIEPEEGHFDEQEVIHYGEMLDECIRNGITPVVTLHHFSSPLWLIRKGGWEADTTPDDFARYVRFVMERLGEKMTWVCTINEANIGVQIAAIAKRYQSQVAKSTSGIQVGINLEAMTDRKRKADEENLRVFGTEQPAVFTSPRTQHGDEIIMRAHSAAVEIIHEISPHVKAGLTLSLHDIQPLNGGEETALEKWEEEFLHYLPFILEDDFLGVQNYTRTLCDRSGEAAPAAGAELTQMGYEFYPQALEHVLRKVNESYKSQILVTENGIATGDDARRIAFIDEALAGVQRCVKDGIPVSGYFYWSLLDNFEWQRGFSMTFGLIAVDRDTQKRFPKDSLARLGQYCGRK